MDLTFPEFDCNGQTPEPSTTREFDQEGAASSLLSQEDHGGASPKQTGRFKGARAMALQHEMSASRPRRRAVNGRMVLCRGSSEPYKAVLTYEDGRTSEHPFRSLREGEAFLRDVGSMD
jgi:hypothetical protein